jgi:hypothetical protein
MQKSEPPAAGARTQSREMDQRINRLESDIKVLSQNQTVLSDSFRSFEREMKDGISTLRDGITHALSKMDAHILTEKAQKPPTYREIIAIATQIGILVTMIVSGLYFLVDSHTQGATARTNTFVERMTQDGGYLVQMHDLQLRLAQMERQLNSAIKWRAEIVAGGDPLAPAR